VINVFENLRIFFINAFSWTSTIAVLQLTTDILQILALSGSIVVSMFSANWIMKQSRNLDRVNKKNRPKGGQ